MRKLADLPAPAMYMPCASQGVAWLVQTCRVMAGMQKGWEVLCAGYTRIPVYEKDPQDIIGILYTKDLILVDPGDPQTALSAYINCVSCVVMTLARQIMAGTQNPHCFMLSEHSGLASLQ